jgi:pyrroline-5-carboxylate reductase
VTETLSHSRVVFHTLEAGNSFQESPAADSRNSLLHNGASSTFTAMRYAFLGAGKMAAALIQGMLRAKLCSASDIAVSSRSKGGLGNLAAATSVRAAASNADVMEGADVVLLCVKPGDALKALSEAGGALEGRLLVSVVAGLRLAVLREAASGCRVVRAMPNTAAMVGRSATALAVDKNASQEDMEIAHRIFGAVGEVFSIPEHHFDAVTGLSGSGPAFVYLMMEALSDGGLAAGLPRALALELTIQTIAGAAEMAASTREHPALLREMVASPAGMTIAGLAVLEAAAVRSAFINAVKAAAARSREIAGA